MKRTLVAALCAILAGGSLALLAQSSGQKSLAATLNVSAFPAAGQNAQQQSQDEAACYQWAVQNTGVDPFDAQKKAQQAQQQAAQQQQAAKSAGQGATVGGAAKGAAAGALIGAAAGDAGKGAAIGAASGAVVGRGRKKQAEAQASQQAQAQGQQAQQASAQQIDAFKRSFCACLEGKKYIAKY
ncbi:MAG TPA: YMGG-like glycine zipper-containing protein [Thermoanaerobaculia bacterium]|nr:YMGG-like glycine zipper-containing protein [Thermoanaerobaculia bacterium]